MEDNNYNVNLADMDSIFNNKTLRYRINGFACACGMKDILVTKLTAIEKKFWLDKGPYREIELDSGIIFSTRGNKKTCEGPNYFISVIAHSRIT